MSTLGLGLRRVRKRVTEPGEIPTELILVHSVATGPAVGLILAEDCIAAVNGTSVNGMSLEQVTALLDGPPNTPVELEQSGIISPFRVQLTRGVPSVPATPLAIQQSQNTGTSRGIPNTSAPGNTQYSGAFYSNNNNAFSTPLASMPNPQIEVSQPGRGYPTSSSTGTAPAVMASYPGGYASNTNNNIVSFAGAPTTSMADTHWNPGQQGDLQAAQQEIHYLLSLVQKYRVQAAQDQAEIERLNRELQEEKMKSSRIVPRPPPASDNFLLHQHMLAQMEQRLNAEAARRKFLERELELGKRSPAANGSIAALQNDLGC